MLRVGGVPVGDVTRFGQENLNQAVRRYLNREAHGVIGWSSGDLTQAEQRDDSKVLMDSDQFRVTMDVVVSGSRALQTKREALQAFHDAWFEAEKMTIEQPDRAAQAMARWNASWTGVATPQDLRGALEEFAQATLQDNQAVMGDQNLPLLYEPLQGGPDGLAAPAGGRCAASCGTTSWPQVFRAGLRARLGRPAGADHHPPAGEPHLPPHRPTPGDGADPGAAAAPDHRGRARRHPGAVRAGQLAG